MNIFDKIVLDTNSKRYEDKNGFLCIDNNPIAKAGVFEYLGESLGLTGEDSTKIFKVYRSFDELEKTANTFQGIPIILDHEWVTGDSSNPTIMGTIGGNIKADSPYLYADIKIINNEARTAIENGTMKELSPGYTSSFKYAPGEYDGEQYEYIQYDMFYNHLALVNEGRAGHDLKIQDNREDVMDLEKLKQLIIDFIDEEKKENEHNEDEAEEIKDEGEEKTADTEEEKEEETVDAEEEKEEIKEIVGKQEEDDEEEEKEKQKQTTDAREYALKMINEYKQQHGRAMQAYDEVSEVVGTFKTYDKKGNMLNENAIYKTGCERLGLDKVSGITDYKTAFKVASFMQAKNKGATNNNKVIMDAIENDATVEALINNIR